MCSWEMILLTSMISFTFCGPATTAQCLGSAPDFRRCRLLRSTLVPVISRGPAASAHLPGSTSLSDTTKAMMVTQIQQERTQSKGLTDRDAASGDRKRDLNECCKVRAEGVDEHLTARMFFSAFTHCALAMHFCILPSHSFRVQTR